MSQPKETGVSCKTDPNIVKYCKYTIVQSIHSDWPCISDLTLRWRSCFVNTGMTSRSAVCPSSLKQPFHAPSTLSYTLFINNYSNLITSLHSLGTVETSKQKVGALVLVRTPLNNNLPSRWASAKRPRLNLGKTLHLQPCLATKSTMPLVVGPCPICPTSQAKHNRRFNNQVSKHKQFLRVLCF